VDDLAGDGVGESDVRADVQPEPQIGPLRGRRTAGIDDVELRAVMDALQNVVEVDRVRVTRVGAPEDDDIRLLYFLI
jgi:hypothetical protein